MKCDWRVEDSNDSKDLQDPINNKISNINGLINQKYLKNSKDNSSNTKIGFWGEGVGGDQETHCEYINSFSPSKGQTGKFSDWGGKIRGKIVFKF